jgi:hypothetical protein
VVKNFSNKKDKKAYPVKSRKKYDCPPQLKDLLTKMNWLEPELTLWVFNDALRLTRAEKPHLDGYKALQASFEICLTDLPVEFQNFIKYGVPILPKDNIEMLALVAGDVITDINNRIFRYEDFRLSRLKLSRLAMFNKKEFDLVYGAMAISQDFGGTGILRVDENGIVHIVNDSFGEAINGVIIDRIRSCEICERVFWATNVNSKACSPKHAANLRLQKSRKINKEKRKENRNLENAKRRETYKNKKELKKGNERGKKRNGSL